MWARHEVKSVPSRKTNSRSAGQKHPSLYGTKWFTAVFAIGPYLDLGESSS